MDPLFAGKFAVEDVSSMAAMAVAAYGAPAGERLEELMPEGWVVVTDLGTLSSGYIDADGMFTNANQAGFIARNGDKIALVFRGSDGPWFSLLTDYESAAISYAAAYQNISPLISAFITYANANRYNISNVFITGHSLGGEIAELFGAFPAGTTNLLGQNFNGIGDLDYAPSAIGVITFGSPGIALGAHVTAAFDSRVVNIDHTGDPVFNHSWGILGALDNPPLNFVHPADSQFDIDMPNADLFSEHDMRKYADDISEVTSSLLYEFSAVATRFISGGTNADLFSAHNVLFAASNDPAVQSFVLGGQAGDILVSYAGSDLLSGQDGADSLRGQGGDDRLEGGLGNDTLDGGAGTDTAYFRSDRANYSISFDGSSVVVTDVGPSALYREGTDTLRDVEYLQFRDQRVPVAQPGSGALPTLSVADPLADYEGAAGSHQVRFAVSISGSPSVPVTVNFSTADGTATAGSDYVARSGTLTFQAGAASTQYIYIEVEGDTVQEASESFSLVLSSPSAGATLGDGAGVSTILNDDGAAPPPPSLAMLSVSDGQIVEGNNGITMLRYTVAMSGASATEVTVNFATADGSATIADGDYNGGAGTLHFLPGQTTLVVDIPVLGDTKVEADESFSVILSAPVGAAISDGSAVGSIYNDDIAASALPIVSIANAAPVVERNPADDHSFLDFLVSLSSPATTQTTVNWFTTDGTAVYDGLRGDYEAHSDLLYFAAGEQFKHIRIDVDTDTLVEGNETLNVSLYAPNGARIGTASASGTILNDDSATIGIDDSAALEGNSSVHDAQFFVHLSNASQAPVTVHYTASGLSAQAGSDFAETSGTLTFNPGETLKPIIVPVYGDIAVEANETFTLTLDSPVGASIGDGTGLGTIISDDDARLWNFVGTQKVAASANPLDPNIESADLSLSLDSRYTAYSAVVPNRNGWINVLVYDKQTGQSTEVTSGLSGHSMEPSVSADGRYVAYQSGDPTFVSGDTNGKTDIFVTDRLTGAVERISVSGLGEQGDGNSVTPSISADGRYVAFASAADNLVANDTNGQQDIFVYDRVSKTIARINVGANGAEANADSTLPVISADGNVVSFNTLASNLVPEDHNVRWDTYAYDRTSQTLEVVSTYNTNGGYGNTGSLYQSGLSADGRFVAFNTDWGFAQADTNSRWDAYVYDRVLGTYTEVSVGPDGQQGNQDTYGEVQISPDGSQVKFLDFSSNFFGGDNANTADTFVATFEPAPTASVSSVAVIEGQAGTTIARFTVGLSGATVQPVTLSYLTEDGTALAGSDYIARTGSLTFAPGETSKVVDVSILGDVTYESAENFDLRIYSASHAVIGSAGIGTILNDDLGPPTVAIDDAALGEGNGGTTVATFRVTLSAGWSAPVTVSYATIDASALGGADFTPVAGGVVTFAPGQTEQTINISIAPDTVHEGNESFLVALTSPSGAVLGRATAVGTIVNDDGGDGLAFVTAQRLTVTATGTQETTDSSWDEAISGDGRFIVFRTFDGHLVADDTNNHNDIYLFDRQSGAISRLSNGLGGAQSNGESTYSVISADGRFVSFSSTATNLVAGTDANSFNYQVYVLDRQSGQVERTSVALDGSYGNEGSLDSSLSSDGRFVAFRSNASNLVSGDTNGVADIFVRDRLAGTTEIVSVSDAGATGNTGSYAPVISGDGRYVTYVSAATTLAAGDVAGTFDIFVHDRSTGQTREVTVGADGNSDWATISADGKYVAFVSSADNLVADDHNGRSDIFVYQLATGAIQRVSVGADGVEADGASDEPSLSADGRYATFRSVADNLVAGDTNGAYDVFIFDRQNASIKRVSLTASGAEIASGVVQDGHAAIAADGSVVLFKSTGANIVTGDTNGLADLFAAVLDGGIKVTIADASVSEGNVGSQDAVFSISLAHAATSDVVISWSTADGDAVAGQDYVAATGTLIFHAGETAKTVAIGVLGDAIVEQDESFSLVLSGDSSVTFDRAVATGHILNDDAGSAAGTVFTADSLTLPEATANATLIGSADVTLVGNDANNLLTGNAGANLLIGGGGSDKLDGQAGNDLLYAGDGDDVVLGGAGADIVIGGSGAGDDVYDGGGDVDTVIYSSAINSIAVDLRTNDRSGLVPRGADEAGPNADSVGALLVDAGYSATTPVGLASGADIGTDALIGIENVVGGSGADSIGGNAGANVLNGGDGDDTLEGGGGIDTLTGNGGEDRFDYRGGDVTITDFDVASLIEAIALRVPAVDAFDDLSISYSGGDATIDFGSGNVLRLKAVADLLAATDFVFNQSPVITTNGGGDAAVATCLENGILVATVQATDADAGLIFSVSGGADAGKFSIDATSGVLRFSAAPDFELPQDAGSDNVYDVVVAVSDGVLTDTQTLSVHVSNVAGARITGTAAANTIDATHSVAGQPFATDEEDLVFGGGGRDKITGLGGNDTIDGGAGADTMRGGTGNDVYLVDSASDVVDESGGAGVDLVRASVTFNLANPLHATGLVENLTLLGSKALAGAGNLAANLIIGNSGANLLSGSAGDDTLRGSGGNDTVIGAAGIDQMSGGAGKDIFKFAATSESGPLAPTRDVITDFIHGMDKIDVSAIDANRTAAGNQTFVLNARGNARAHVSSGHIGWHWEDNEGTANDRTIIRLNNDGDSTIESTIQLNGLIRLTAVDFVL